MLHVGRGKVIKNLAQNFEIAKLGRQVVALGDKSPPYLDHLDVDLGSVCLALCIGRLGSTVLSNDGQVERGLILEGQGSGDQNVSGHWIHCKMSWTRSSLA